MKIRQLLSGVSIATTNEENQFIDAHRESVKINALTERDQWLAQNLVRKGIYSISKDNSTLHRSIHEANK